MDQISPNGSKQKIPQNLFSGAFNFQFRKEKSWNFLMSFKIVTPIAAIILISLSRVKIY